MHLGATLMGFLIVIVAKGLVMLLTARILYRLFRTLYVEKPKQPWLLIPQEYHKEFTPLVWGMILFGLSELICAVEIYIIAAASVPMAICHSVTSAVGMGLTAIGLFQILDRKYFHLIDSSAPCIALKTCRACSKSVASACEFRPLLIMSSCLFIFMAVPAFFVSTNTLVSDPSRYLLPFETLNAWYDNAFVPWLTAIMPTYTADSGSFYLPEEMLIAEFRVIPIVGTLFAFASLIAFVLNREKLGLDLLFMAVGCHSYVYFEILIYPVTNDLLAGALFHEVGELFFLVMFSEFLTRTFPRITEPSLAR